MRPVRRQTAFTLAEVLAVVVLLGIVGALTIGVASPLGNSQSRILAESTTREAIQRAALTARRSGGGGCELVLGDHLLLRVEGSPIAGRITSTELPRGWRVTAIANRTAGFDRDRDQDQLLRFGPDGVTSDVALELIGPRGDRLRLRVVGLTAAVERMELDP